jgi:hypothetical protein
MSRRRSWLARISAPAAVFALTGCWLAVGVEDRQVTRCGYPFVEVAQPTCTSCASENCCAEMSACEDSAACLACTRPLPSPEPPCTAPAEFTALQSCVHNHCQTECYPNEIPDLPAPYCNTLQSTSGGKCVSEGDWFGHVRCNPITNEPCDGQAGEACSFDWGIRVFACHAAGQEHSACDTCGLVEGLCAPGFDCANGQCYRYCCGDADCAPNGKCWPIRYPGLTIGACVVSD